MLTIGYIGNGKSTNRYHLPFVLQRKDKIKVKTIYDAHLGSPIFPLIPVIHYTDNLDELLNDEEIDLIVVCRRNQHYEYAKMVLEHGKNCMVEKPLVEDTEKAKELYALAKENNLLVQPYQNRRYDSDFLTTQKVIESGKLGELLEVEMHFDYYRPDVPEQMTTYSRGSSYLYGHASHTIDQVMSYFGNPESVHYDVRQLLGKGRMNDYFDIDMYYGILKVSVKSSYFRAKERPSFIVYGKQGYFVKEKKDRQEEHLKLFHMPDNEDFGIDRPEDYGTLIYYDDQGVYHEEKVVSEVGDYGRVYDDLYDVIVNGKDKVITENQVLWQMEILENGIKTLEDR